jgi:predicted amidohydrolase
MVMRAIENSVWFASCNYALDFQESASTIIDPDGCLAAFAPYGEELLLVHDLDLSRATGFYANRLNREQYASRPDEKGPR